MQDGAHTLGSIVRPTILRWSIPNSSLGMGRFGTRGRFATFR